jgi:hypothetical protein
MVRSATGTLRWAGPGLIPGAVAWDLGRSSKVSANVEVSAASPTDGVRVLIDLPAAEAEDFGRVSVYSPDPDDVREVATAFVPTGREIVLGGAPGWLLADVDRDEGPTLRRVAGPVRARPGALVTLKPRPGGYVVFAPSTAPPEGIAEIVVARADGAPFPYWQRNGRDAHACAAALCTGAILGPFEPGTVSFDVFVGGVRWGRYEVTVREGVWTTLAPRPFR